MPPASPKIKELAIGSWQLAKEESTFVIVFPSVYLIMAGRGFITSPFLFLRTCRNFVSSGASGISFVRSMVSFPQRLIHFFPCACADVRGIVMVCGLGVFYKKNCFGLLVSARVSKTVIRGGETVSCFTVSGFWFSCTACSVVFSALFEQEE